MSKLHHQIQQTLDDTKSLLHSSTLKLMQRGMLTERLETASADLEYTSRAFVLATLPWHLRCWEWVKQKVPDCIPFYYCCH
jgi:hypothetical protein